MTRTQNEQLLELLKTRPVTPLDALREIGSFRLSASVYDLRHQGHNIASRMVSVGGLRVAEYSMGNV